MKENTNPFRLLQSLGYHHIVPIIPPGAQLSERSSLYKRMHHPKKPRDERGKVPGICRNGEWFSYAWQKDHEAEPEFWQSIGAGVGIKPGQVFDDENNPLPGHMIAIDADTYLPEYAAIVEKILDARIGKDVPKRVGRAPKALYVIRTDEDFRQRPIIFGDKDESGQRPNRVEFLTKDRQFIARGIHPKTMQPYKWERPLVAAKNLPFVSGEDLRSIVLEIIAALPNADLTPDSTPRNTTPVPPEKRRASLKLVQEALQALPNTPETHPTRDHYILVMYAVRGSLPEHPNEAYDEIEEWALKWEDNTPDSVRDDWDGMTNDPYSGFNVLLNELRRCGKEAVAADLLARHSFDQAGAEAAIKADAEREAAEKEGPLFPPELPNLFEQGPGSGLFEMLSVSDIMAMPPPRYLIDRHIMQQSTCILYGDPGSGKSFLSLDWALHLASGAPDWHGDEIDPIEKPSVVYIAGEGVSGYQTRIKAWLARHPGVDPALPGFRLVHQSMNFTSSDLVEKLVKSIKHICGGATLIVVDTVAKATTGSEENSTKEMGIFVDVCVNISKHFRCSVLGVHHTNKMGGMRGSSSLPGGVDTVFKLERKKGSNTGYLFCEKQKDGPGEWTETFQLETVCVGVNHKGQPVSSLVVSKEAAEVREATTQATMLDALDDAWKMGAPWSDQPRSKDRYAPRLMAQRFDVSAAHAQEILSGWISAGVVVVDTLSAKSKTKGLRRVVFDTEEEPQNPFD